MWSVPGRGENVEISIRVQDKEGSSRYSGKYQSGPVLVTLDWVAETSHQSSILTKNRSIELKAPVLGVPQSKIDWVYSYDANSDVRYLFYWSVKFNLTCYISMNRSTKK